MIFHFIMFLVLLSIMLHKAHFVEYYGIVLFKFAAFFFCNHLISTTCVSLLSWTFPVLFCSPVMSATARLQLSQLCVLLDGFADPVLQVIVIFLHL